MSGKAPENANALPSKEVANFRAVSDARRQILPCRGQ